MNDLGWHRPSRAIDGPTALRSILAQHRQIRGLLDRARQIGDNALEQEGGLSDVVASTIGDLRTAFEVHMSFEETVLPPVFERLGASGARRTHELVADHENQRAMLHAIHREAMLAPNLPILAVKLTFLACWLLSDMADEERTLRAVLGDP